jgi:hypothetical protein
MKRIKLFGVLAMALLPGAAAYAGYVGHLEVVISLDASGNVTGAFGNLADAHNSADPNQYIGCGILSGPSGHCEAHDASADADGVLSSAFCYTEDPVFMDNIRALGSDSTVGFAIDPTTGDCLTVNFSHQSTASTKAP